ncbi:MAG: hypothetical protein HZA91_02155 [Verrucomicrobia bacterium]|nr:hypothetical protein [Verrucomicrobiota bacterium]
MNRLTKCFLIALGAVLAVSLLWMLLLALDTNGRMKHFADSGYDMFIPPHPATGAKASQTMAAQSGGAMFRLFVVTLLGGGAVLVLLWFNGSAKPALRYGCFGALALLLFIEQWQANSHFMDYYPPAQLYADNDVFKKLRSAPGRPRVALLTRAGFYNTWLSLHFPYHDIDSIDITAASRPPADYVAFFGAVDRTPPRKWELCAVRYVLGPKDQGAQLFQSQGVDKLVNVALEFDSQFGKQALFEYTRALPRAVMLHRWETIADPDKTLARLADPKFDPQTTVLLMQKAEANLKADPAAPPATPVEIVKFDQARVILRVTPRSPGILLLNDRFDGGWTATVDGFPAEILRANFIMRGIALEPGDHRIVFRYNIPASSKLITWGVWSLIGLGLIATGLGALRRKLAK